MQVPSLSTDQMIEVDRLMIEVYGISLEQMMENAGRALAEMGRTLLEGKVADHRIAVLCGPGNNGGGGMVAARHLHDWGAMVEVALAADTSDLKDLPRRQWAILERMEVQRGAPKLDEADLIVDALLGYGAQGNPRPPISDWIERMNAAHRPILSLDAPSGLNTSTGEPGVPCIRAATTLTLALPKTGLLVRGAAPFVGQLFLADISVPPELYRHLGLEISSPFVDGPIVMIK